MKTSVLLAGLVTLVAFMATASFCAPSSIGPTGILNVPTTDSVMADSFEALLAYDSLEVAGDRINLFPVLTLGYGFKNAEIGISYHNIKGHTAVKGANAKYVFCHKTEKSPGIAAGVIYLKGDVAETDLYVVAGQKIGEDDRLRATAGLLYQKPSYSGSDSNFTGMLGLEYNAPTEKTTIGIDYIFDDIAAGSMFGVTLREQTTPDFAWQIGAGSSGRYFLGVTMKFGGK